MSVGGGHSWRARPVQRHRPIALLVRPIAEDGCPYSQNQSIGRPLSRRRRRRRRLPRRRLRRPQRGIPGDLPEREALSSQRPIGRGGFPIAACAGKDMGGTLHACSPGCRLRVRTAAVARQRTATWLLLFPQAKGQRGLITRIGLGRRQLLLRAPGRPRRPDGPTASACSRTPPKPTSAAAGSSTTYNVTAYDRIAESFAARHQPGPVIVITGEGSTCISRTP